LFGHPRSCLGRMYPMRGVEEHFNCGAFTWEPRGPTCWLVTALAPPMLLHSLLVEYCPLYPDMPNPGTSLCRAQGGIPLGESPGGIRLGKSPWGIPQGKSPGGSSQGIAHGGSSQGESPGPMALWPPGPIGPLAPRAYRPFGPPGLLALWPPGPMGPLAPRAYGPFGPPGLLALWPYIMMCRGKSLCRHIRI